MIFPQWGLLMNLAELTLVELTSAELTTAELTLGELTSAELISADLISAEWLQSSWVHLSWVPEWVQCIAVSSQCCNKWLVLATQVCIQQKQNLPLEILNDPYWVFIFELNSRVVIEWYHLVHTESEAGWLNLRFPMHYAIAESVASKRELIINLSARC